MEYPQDIIDAAKNALAPIMSPDLASDYEIRLVAKAIMDERERCANIAQSFPANVLQFWDRPGGPPGNGYRPATHEDIAAAIRASPVSEREEG